MLENLFTFLARRPIGGGPGCVTLECGGWTPLSYTYPARILTHEGA
jgi:hypothetical protein